jgi:hypothetical protein
MEIDLENGQNDLEEVKDDSKEPQKELEKTQKELKKPLNDTENAPKALQGNKKKDLKINSDKNTSLTDLT